MDHWEIFFWLISIFQMVIGATEMDSKVTIDSYMFIVILLFVFWLFL